MKKGFTLVEVMIIVAIIGLLAAIAIPSLHKANEEAATAAATERTIKALTPEVIKAIADSEAGFRDKMLDILTNMPFINLRGTKGMLASLVGKVS